MLSAFVTFALSFSVSLIFLKELAFCLLHFIFVSLIFISASLLSVSLVSAFPSFSLLWVSLALIFLAV